MAPSEQQIANNVGSYMNQLPRRKQVLLLAYRGRYCAQCDT